MAELHAIVCQPCVVTTPTACPAFGALQGLRVYHGNAASPRRFPFCQAGTRREMDVIEKLG
jgi:hypothetical protein